MSSKDITALYGKAPLQVDTSYTKNLEELSDEEINFLKQYNPDLFVSAEHAKRQKGKPWQTKKM